MKSAKNRPEAFDLFELEGERLFTSQESTQGAEGEAVWAVSDFVNWYADEVEELPMPNLWIEGEVSDFKLWQGKMGFFSLKDAEAKFACHVSVWDFPGRELDIQNGEILQVKGRLSCNAKRGETSLKVTDFRRLHQTGNLLLQLENLKKKLKAEGLFDLPKKEIPKSVRRLGVVTSPTGAVIHDIWKEAVNRSPFADILLYPSLVQGEAAPATLIKGIEVLGAREDISVIIIGRGGGSLEDLWCFNDEALVRAIAACPKPVISAVGHQVDNTLCDLVADLRAATPTQAASFAYQVTREQYLNFLLAQRRKLEDSLLQVLEEGHQELRAASQSLSAQRVDQRLQRDALALLAHRRQLEALHPAQLLERASLQLQATKTIFQRQQKEQWERAQRSWQQSKERWLAVDPLLPLKRGFALLQTEDGRVPASVSELREQEMVRLKMRDGQLCCQVQRIEKSENL